MALVEEQLEKRIFVDGVFDLFHKGHRNMIRNAITRTQEKYPDAKIIVLVGICDEGVDLYKRKTITSLEERVQVIDTFLRNLQANQPQLSFEILPNSPITPTRAFAKKHHIDIFFHGNDFSPEDIKKYYGSVLDISELETLPYTQGVSTTTLIVNLWRTGSFLSNVENKTNVDTDELATRIQSRDLGSLGITPSKYFSHRV